MKRFYFRLLRFVCTALHAHNRICHAAYMRLADECERVGREIVARK